MDNIFQFVPQSMSEQDIITIIIADDHETIRMGLKYTLKESFNAEIYEAADGDELFALVKKQSPHVILLDINMPNTNSQAIVQNILLLKPMVSIIIFSVNKEEIYGKFYLKLGVRGYLQKDAASAEITKAIRTVLAGNVYMRKEMQEFYLSSRGNDNNTSPYGALSKKEMEILHHLASGESLTNIARMTNLSASTIGTHKANIFSKLHINNIIELKEFTDLHPLLN